MTFVYSNARAQLMNDENVRIRHRFYMTLSQKVPPNNFLPSSTALYSHVTCKLGLRSFTLLSLAVGQIGKCLVTDHDSAPCEGAFP